MNQDVPPLPDLPDPLLTRLQDAVQILQDLSQLSQTNNHQDISCLDTAIALIEMCALNLHTANRRDEVFVRRCFYLILEQSLQIVEQIVRSKLFGNCEPWQLLDVYVMEQRLMDGAYIPLEPGALVQLEIVRSCRIAMCTACLAN